MRWVKTSRLSAQDPRASECFKSLKGLKLSCSFRLFLHFPFPDRLYISLCYMLIFVSLMLNTFLSSHAFFALGWFEFFGIVEVLPVELDSVILWWVKTLRFCRVPTLLSAYLLKVANSAVAVTVGSNSVLHIIHWWNIPSFLICKSCFLGSKKLLLIWQS